MNKLFLSAVLLFCSNASASLIGSIDHNYGSAAYVPSFMGADACDTKNASSVTVKDSSNCQRFVDLFDFSALNFDSIDYFQLDLTFAATNNNNCVFIFCDNESWKVRPAASTISAPSSNLQSLTRANGMVQQSFVFNATNLSSIFNDIVSNGRFYLWFAESSSGSDQFDLYSANLSVHGTPSQPLVDPVPVPAPASVALFGLGLLMLRRFKK